MKRILSRKYDSSSFEAWLTLYVFIILNSMLLFSVSISVKVELHSIFYYFANYKSIKFVLQTMNDRFDLWLCSPQALIFLIFWVVPRGDWRCNNHLPGFSVFCLTFSILFNKNKLIITKKQCKNNFNALLKICSPQESFYIAT